MGFATRLLEETGPFPGWGLPLGPVDEFAVQLAEWGAQRDGTAADGIVEFRADLPLPRQQAGLRAFEGQTRRLSR